MLRHTYPTIYKSILILVFSSSMLFAANVATLIHVGFKQKEVISACIVFFFPHFLNVWEIALMLEINNSIRAKFKAVNAIVRAQTRIASFKQVSLISTEPNINKSLKIRDVMEIHYRLTNLSKRVNKLFECPILLTTAVNFEASTLTLYYFIEGIQGITGSTQRLANSPVLFWAVILLSEIAILMRSFQNVTDEVCGKHGWVKSKREF